MPPHLSVSLLLSELIRQLFDMSSQGHAGRPFLLIQVFQQCLRLLQVMGREASRRGSRYPLCCGQAPLACSHLVWSVLCWHQDDALKSWEALLRISTTPTPFVYRHLLAVMLFTFIFTYVDGVVFPLSTPAVPTV